MAITIQPISPVAMNLFSLEIRWYALAYIAAFIVGYYLLRLLAQKQSSECRVQSAVNEDCHAKRDVKSALCTLHSAHSKKFWDDLLTYVIFGVIIGGRLGYVLFYNLSFFIAHPLEIFAIWHGGMAFHGGLLGVIIAVFLFSRSQSAGRRAQVSSKVKDKNSNTDNSNLINSNPPALCALRSSTYFFGILDLMAVVTPIGLFFGRIANFINMEVMGRPTESPLGIVFVGADGTPIGDGIPRHASPLYEAALEGILLFIIMFALWRWTRLRERAGALSGAFAMLYAAARIFAEQFRAPDAQIGFLTSWGLTMGQLLSALMFIAGTIIFAIAMRKTKGQK